jgi:hypothetical protein
MRSNVTFYRGQGKFTQPASPAKRTETADPRPKNGASRNVGEYERASTRGIDVRTL